MIPIQRSRLFYTIAGSGVVLGIYTYLNQEGHIVKNSWTTNFEPSVKWDHNWDKRDYSNQKTLSGKTNLQDPSKEGKKTGKPTARRHIFLIRHGQYDMDARHDADRRLTALGLEQADQTGKRLKELNFNYTKIIHSTMTRARQTSEIVQKHLPDVKVENCDLLREGAPAEPDPPISGWTVFKDEFGRDNARIESAFQKYFHRADVDQKSDSFEIIVCHANVIRYFICRVLQFPPQGWARFSLHHGSISWIVIAPSGKSSVVTIGDSGFFPPSQLTLYNTHMSKRQLQLEP